MKMEAEEKSRFKLAVTLILVGIAVNVGLAVVKLYVGLSSNSITIMLDATNSTLDIVTTAITLTAFLCLLAPRGKSAPFGYGRGEYLAGFIVAVVAAIVGVLFFVQSLNRMAMPEPIWFGWQNCVLICVTVPFKLGLGLLYGFANRKLKSKAIKAMTLDSFMDVGITSASIVAFAVSSQVDYAADAIFGMVISVVVVAFAIKLIAENVKNVVKGDGAEDERIAVKKLLKADGKIKRVGNITLHDYGFRAKSGTAEVAFKDGVSIEEIKTAEAETREKIKRECGAEIWLVPLDEDTLDGEFNKWNPQKSSAENDKDENFKKDSD